MKLSLMKKGAMAAIILLAATQGSIAADATALEVAKEGNRYVGEQSKDKIVQIRSEKSIASLTPAIWYVVYYDPDATLKAVEVKFGAGQKLDVSHPLRLLEPVGGGHKPMERSRIKIDSDQALKIAQAEPLLKALTLKASQLWLQNGDTGPVWKIKLWAAKLKHPNSNANIGELYISAEDGKVVQSKLHINSVD